VHPELLSVEYRVEEVWPNKIYINIKNTLMKKPRLNSEDPCYLSAPSTT
jgi:hypothetical protein